MIGKFRIIKVCLVLLLVSGCSTYPSKFKCGDARGLGCTMLSEIDRQIDSGEIEEVYQDKKCKGSSCLKKKNTPGLALKNQDRAEIYYEDDSYLNKSSDKNYLYF